MRTMRFDPALPKFSSCERALLFTSPTAVVARSGCASRSAEPPWILTH